MQQGILRQIIVIMMLTVRMELQFFTFYINDDFSVSQDREEIMHDIGGQTVLPSIIDRGNFATSSVARAMSSVPDVSNSIAVYYNNQTKKLLIRETYIYTVLSSELYGKSYYTGKGLNFNTG